MSATSVVMSAAAVAVSARWSRLFATSASFASAWIVALAVSFHVTVLSDFGTLASSAAMAAFDGLPRMAATEAVPPVLAGVPRFVSMVPTCVWTRATSSMMACAWVCTAATSVPISSCVFAVVISLKV